MLRVPRKIQRVFQDCSLSDVYTPDLLAAFSPGKTVFVSLPECPMTIWGDDRTEHHRICGVFISRMHLEGKQNEVGFAFFVNGHANDKSTDPMDDANFWFCISASNTTESLDELLQSGAAGAVSYPHALVPGSPKWEDFARSTATALTAVRIALNALLHRGEPTQETTYRIEEREEILGALARIKNHSKGKAKRLLRRLEELEEHPIVRIVPDVSSGRWTRPQSRKVRLAEARERLRLAAEKENRAAALLEVRLAMSSPENSTLRWKED